MHIKLDGLGLGPYCVFRPYDVEIRRDRIFRARRLDHPERGFETIDAKGRLEQARKLLLGGAIESPAR